MTAVEEVVRLGGSERWAIEQLGVSRGTYYRRKAREKEGQLDDRRRAPRAQPGTLPEEEAAMIEHAKYIRWTAIVAYAGGAAGEASRSGKSACGKQSCR